MASSSEPSPNEGLHVLLNDLKLTDPTTFRSQQINIILALRERVLKCLIGKFIMEDLVWTDRVTTSSGVHKSSKLVVILRNYMAIYVIHGSGPIIHCFSV
jgi:hypothetical protein